MVAKPYEDEEEEEESFVSVCVRGVSLSLEGAFKVRFGGSSWLTLDCGMIKGFDVVRSSVFAVGAS